MAIEKEAILYDEASYRSRVYATFNHSNIRCTFMLQRTVKQKNSTIVGTITYNTCIKNGCLRYLREILNGNWIWYLYNRVL
jgi:hypothetical protein